MENADDKIRSADVLEALMKEVDAEIELTLRNAGVYSVDAYGWCDHETQIRSTWGITCGKPIPLLSPILSRC